MTRILIALFLTFTLTSCATKTGQDLKEVDKYPPISWTVNQPIQEVYKAYKDHAEKNLSGGDFLWSGGLRVRSDFYGMEEGADLEVKMEGNPLAPVTYLRFELSKSGTGTNIRAWYYNNPWRHRAEEFRDDIF
ncbi:hypothetical protein [Salipiger sp. PrR003]|uniref:hypothetical protein n=1 Tax=Salipiger sp. PrR003 TaxID=2706776 RepID=UPI0013DB2AF0|nr:hypothetical protein [Salipiger sp. PrR003]NDV50097.1 hypothetical protein [Salipiger sp. PrR003]